MLTRVQTLEQLSQLFIESMLNNTDKVTKIAPNSVLHGVADGIGVIAQSAVKDIALIEARLFPDDAHGQYLDQIASNFGVSDRKVAFASSTYLRLVGTPGTIYSQSVHTFSGNHGIVFEMQQDITIPAIGYVYVKVNSLSTGSKTNVSPLTINRINTTPNGHKFVINEYVAIGGSDVESDDDFRERIKNAINVNNRGSIEYLNQLFQSINPLVFRTFFTGTNSLQQCTFKIVTCNGQDLSSNDLSSLSSGVQSRLNLSDLRFWGDQTLGIVCGNVEYFAIDVDFRVAIDPTVDLDLLRKNIQVAFSKEIDFKTWTWDKKIEWDNLLQIVKNTPGILYASDAHFKPGSDIIVQKNKFPRFRGFTMRDLNGNVITDIQGNLNPIFYQ